MIGISDLFFKTQIAIVILYELLNLMSTNNSMVSGEHSI